MTTPDIRIAIQKYSKIKTLNALLITDLSCLFWDKTEMCTTQVLKKWKLVQF